jgi:magnesium transporter
VVSDLRDHVATYSDYEVQYAYVVSPEGHLLGVLPMRDLLLARGEAPIHEVMITRPVRVTVDTPLERLIELFEDHASFIGIPVTDSKDRLVGVVRRTAVLEAAGERADSSFLKISGIVGGEEYRSMPLFLRAFRRLSFLAPNIVLNMIAASVIALYQGTLQAVIALAVFLPIISDMSGCSGNQAVAVSIRELSLGLIRPTEFLRVFAKETWLGLFNGAVLGIMLGGVAVLWKGNWILGLVVGSALALNTLLSVLLGGSVPLLLKRLRVDPALASGPILTTVTDMCGFFLVLSFASATLSRL